jgi:thiaminase/transcriptional activator TenA
MATFSETLWQGITEIYRRILAHPFLTGLTDGTLPDDAFRFYAVQDALYLRDFGRGLALLAAKSPTDDAMIMFSDHAKNALVVERALHGSFFCPVGPDATAGLCHPAGSQQRALYLLLAACSL